jgi:tetratricopeptide (TPR) repeat protein
MLSSYETCEICEREAAFICGDCQMAKYCTSEHRSEHWRVHKEQCKVVKQERIRKIEEAANKNRFEIRKRYFEHFSHKIYDQCIVIARELFDLERVHMEVTKEIFNEFEFGISACLLCRTYLLINRKFEAKQEIDNYIREKLHFLEDLRNLPTLKEVPNYPLRVKEFLEKKLALIAAVTNIYHELKENCIRYYQIYTNHIELVFGPESLELSNVYFCVGNYYKEISEVTKSIACFVKAATIRGKKGGDCYVNIGLLYRRQNRIYAAIDMIQTAIKLNEEEYGSNSREVGEVYEKLGLLYLDIQDFNNAIANLENALKIFINQKESDDYERIREKIEIIYNKIKLTVDQESLKEKKFQKKKEEEKRIEDIQKSNDLDFKKPLEVDKIFKISDTLMNKLAPMDLFRLSELQLMLEQCRSEFSIAFTVGNSDFFKKLNDNRRK